MINAVGARAFVLPHNLSSILHTGLHSAFHSSNMSQTQPMTNNTDPSQANRASQVITENYAHFAARYHHPYANYAHNMALLQPTMQTPEAYLSSHISTRNADTGNLDPPSVGDVSAHNNISTLNPNSTPAAAPPQQQSSYNYPLAHPYPYYGPYYQSYPNTQNQYFPNMVSPQSAAQQAQTNPATVPVSSQHQANSHPQMTPQLSTPYVPPMSLNYPITSQLPSSANLTPSSTNPKHSTPTVAMNPISNIQQKSLSKHLNSNNVVCKICNVFCSTQDQLNIHVSGNKHKKRALIYDDFVKAESSFGQHGISQSAPNIWTCSRCRASMDCMNSVLQHLVSLKHRRLLDSAQNSVRNQEKRTNVSDRPHTALSSVEPIMAVVNSSMDPYSVQPLPHPSSFALSNPFGEYVPTLPTIPPCNAQDPVPETVNSIPKVGAIDLALSPQPTIAKRRLGDVTATDLSAARLASAAASEVGSNPFHCKHCNVICNSKESMAMHLFSQRHRRRIASRSPSRGKAMSVEYANQSHETTRAISLSLRALPPEKVQNASTPPRPDVDMFCQVCNVPICGRRNFDDHLRGKLHIRNAINAKVNVNTSARIALTPDPPANPSASTSTCSATTAAGNKGNDVAISMPIRDEHGQTANKDNRYGAPETAKGDVPTTKNIDEGIEPAAERANSEIINGSETVDDCDILVVKSTNAVEETAPVAGISVIKIKIPVTQETNKGDTTIPSQGPGGNGSEVGHGRESPDCELAKPAHNDSLEIQKTNPNDRKKDGDSGTTDSTNGLVNAAVPSKMTKVIKKLSHQNEATSPPKKDEESERAETSKQSEGSPAMVSQSDKDSTKGSLDDGATEAASNVTPNTETANG